MITTSLKSRTIVSTTLSWETVILNRWQVHEKFYKKHRNTYTNDFDYLGNIDIDVNKFLSLHRDTSYVGSLNQTKNYLDMCVFDIDDPILDDIKKNLGLKHCAAAAQTLLSGKVVFPHYDTASLEPNPEKITLLTKYYRTLLELYPNLEEYSVDKVFNTCILFLEEWQHGQAFMIGRQAYTNWKPGDVITFPWYMIHSTVNASLSDNRLLIYLAGFIE
jgi:hypothetical protein